MEILLVAAAFLLVVMAIGAARRLALAGLAAIIDALRL